MYVIKFCSNLVVYTYIFKTKRMRSCKIGSNGFIQYFDGEEVSSPNNKVKRYLYNQTPYDSIPSIGFFSDIASEAIDIENQIVKIDLEKSSRVFSGLNFVVVTVNNLLDNF